MQLCSWLKGVHYSFDLSSSLDASRSQLMRWHQQIFSGGTGTKFIFFQPDPSIRIHVKWGGEEGREVSRMLSNLKNNNPFPESIYQSNFFFFLILNSQRKYQVSSRRRNDLNLLILANSFVLTIANERVNQSEMAPRVITLLAKYLLTLIIDGVDVTMDIILN